MKNIEFREYLSTDEYNELVNNAFEFKSFHAIPYQAKQYYEIEKLLMAYKYDYCRVTNEKGEWIYSVEEHKSYNMDGHTGYVKISIINKVINLINT